MLNLDATLMVVDEPGMAREKLARRLRRCGYEVVEAADARDGLARLGQHMVDLVLLAGGLPQNGMFALLAALRARYSRAELPIIVVGAPDPGTAASALRLGASDFVHGGVDPSELLARLELRLEEPRRDALTGLATWRAVATAADAAVLAAAGRRRHVGMIAVELEGFRAVNAAHGFEAGDRALRTFAARLARVAGADGVAGRVGGDTFCLLLPDLPSQGLAHARASALLREAFEPLPVAGQELYLTPVLGVATYPDAAPGARDLFRAAERSLALAREQGNHVVLAPRAPAAMPTILRAA